MFNKKGVIIIEKETSKMDEEELMMLALDAGAEDFETSEEIYEITTEPENFTAVREKLEEEGFEFLEADIQMIPSTTALMKKELKKWKDLLKNLKN